MTRRQWRLAVTGYAILAIAWLIIGGIVIAEVRRVDRDEKTLRRHQDQIGLIAVRATGALCMIAYAEPKQERELVDAFIANRIVPLNLFGNVCVKAVDAVRRDVFDDRSLPESPLSISGVTAK